MLNKHFALDDKENGKISYRMYLNENLYTNVCYIKIKVFFYKVKNSLYKFIVYSEK